MSHFFNFDWRPGNILSGQIKVKFLKISENGKIISWAEIPTK